VHIEITSFEFNILSDASFKNGTTAESIRSQLCGKGILKEQHHEKNIFYRQGFQEETALERQRGFF
jgi:hypothetical protein